ncbi:MAG: D-tyrosyl-tRNA(Tyr) deacylase [Acholeplasmatales bacterium]|nr:D-tyrosyl-tRNA(Tyr) deacylase [Acholeplasmatales bacterium]
MRIVVQRVKEASCTVDGKITGKCNKGFLLFIGFKNDDNQDNMIKCLKKVVGLRIFEDENGKMNRSLKDVDGEILAISQFTLYADCKHGNRPSFTEAMEYNKANTMYEEFVEMLRKEGFNVGTGIFGADMKISLLNDGPVTIILDTDTL